VPKRVHVYTRWKLLSENLQRAYNNMSIFSILNRTHVLRLLADLEFEDKLLNRTRIRAIWWHLTPTKDGQWPDGEPLINTNYFAPSSSTVTLSVYVCVCVLYVYTYIYIYSIISTRALFCAYIVFNPINHYKIKNIFSKTFIVQRKSADIPASAESHRRGQWPSDIDIFGFSNNRVAKRIKSKRTRECIKNVSCSGIHRNQWRSPKYTHAHAHNIHSVKSPRISNTCNTMHPNFTQW